MPDDDLKTCVACRHHQPVPVANGPFIQMQHGCSRLNVRDIVTGAVIHQHCLTERVSREKGSCGWKAKYWEAKLN